MDKDKNKVGGIGSDINFNADKECDVASHNSNSLAEVTGTSGDISLELSQYYDFWIGTNAVYEKWSRANGLTTNEVISLYALYYESECTQSKLSERLSLPKQTVNAVLNSLESRGYVDKSVSIRDKRSKILRLTVTGKDFAHSVLSKLDLLEMTALGKMTVLERRALISSSRTYLKHLSDCLKELPTNDNCSYKITT